MKFRFSRPRGQTSYPTVIWLLGLGSFINVGGLSLLWPVNAIYIHSVLHQPMTIAGLVLMIYSGAGFVGSFLGGWLYDRIGATRVLVIGLVLSAAFIVIPVFNHGWWVYVAVMAFFGMTCAMPFPAMNALAGHAWPDGGRLAFNFLYVANNLGVAAGTAIGGVLAGWSFRAVFWGIAAAYILFLLVVLTVFRSRFDTVRQRNTAAISLPEVNPAAGSADAANTETLAASKRMDGSYPLRGVIPWGTVLVLLVAFILSWSVYVQWQSTISVYMQSLGFKLSEYSVLWTLNGLLIFLAQPAVQWVVRRYPSLTLHMVGGVALFGAAFVLLIFTRRYEFFVLAMVITTAGELFAWPAVPAAVAKVSPEERMGTLQGLVGSSATLGRMLGPVVGGYLYDHASMHAVLLAAAVGTVLPLTLYVMYHRLTAGEHLSPGQSSGQSIL